MFILDALGHKFQPPPPAPRRELPSAKLLRKAFLIAETEHIDDYRAQIMSTFGKVLKFDSTKKVGNHNRKQFTVNNLRVCGSIK